MIELIQQLNNLGWGNVILCFFLGICIIITFISGYKKLLSILGLKSIKSIKETETSQKIKHLQEQIDQLDLKIKETQNSIIIKQEEYHEQSIQIRNKLRDGQDGLKDDVHSVKLLIEQFMSDQNETTVAMLRSSLWRYHKDFMAQNFVTPDGLRTFREMGRVYERAGGDDIYHEKLLPEVEALEIHYPNGSIYNPETGNTV